MKKFLPILVSIIISILGQSLCFGAGQSVSGKIVFTSNRDGNDEIYTMNPDGTHVTRITMNNSYDGSPALSPDGSKIIFHSGRNGNGDIYVMNADGTDQVRMTNNSASDVYPAWSPDGSKIAFESTRDGQSEIYVMNSDGSGLTRLTNNTTYDSFPSWSPDGAKIVFVSNRMGNTEIYTMNTNGTSQTRLTNNTASDSYPSWSPDGNKIAFISTRNGNTEIYIMNADGSNQVRLTNNTVTDSDPCWSPDGSKIIFSSNRDGNYELYVMNNDGSGQTRYTNNSATDKEPKWWCNIASPPIIIIQNGAAITNTTTVNLQLSDGGNTVAEMSFSNDNINYSAWEVFDVTKTWELEPGDGLKTVYARFKYPDDSIVICSVDITLVTTPPTEQIVFCSYRDGNSEIYTMNPDGTDVIRMTVNFLLDTSPAWSPDGSKVVFQSNRDGNYEIYMMNADGSNLIRLTNHTAYDGEAAWSPDGNKIVFTSSRDAPSYEIYVMNIDGTNLIRLTNNTAAYDYNPAWSPDGEKIVFASNRDGNYEIYVMNADGSNQTRLTNNSVSEAYPIWSPDGEKIAFVSTPNGNYEIYVMNADGTNQTRLTNNSVTDIYPDWSPDGDKLIFQSNRDGNYQIYVMNANGGSQTRLTNSSGSDTQPRWWGRRVPPSMTIENGATVTNITTVTLQLSNGGKTVSEMSFSNDNINYSSWEAFNVAKTWETQPGDGLKTIYARFKYPDDSIVTCSADITLDTVLPTGAIIIENDAEYAIQPNVVLNLSATDIGSEVSWMRFSDDGVSYSSWEEFAAVKNWQLPGGDGTKNVFVQFRDLAGNLSDAYSDSIIKDTLGPVGYITINNGALVANSTGATLTLSAVDAESGVAEMRFSNDNVNYTDWEAYAVEKSWTIENIQGWRYVYAQFRNNHGNISTYYDTICFDISGPIGSVSIENGASMINSNQVTLNLSANDSGTWVTQMRFSGDGSVFSSWEPYAAQKANYNLGGDGNQTVYVQFMDYAGYLSGIYQDSILVDAQAPVGKILVNNGGANTNNTAVTLNLWVNDGDGSGVSQMRFSNDGVNFSPWEIYMTRSKPWDLSGGNGEKTVFVQFKDNINNISTYSDTINLDTSLPAQPQFLSGDQIVFTSQRDGHSQIYAMNQDGACQTNLSQNSYNDSGPTLSHDQSRIIFVSDRDGNRELYAMNPDGTGQTNLTSNSADDFDPALSRDGKRIAFASNRDGINEIYVMNIDGTGLYKLTDCSPYPATDPTWSPDGTKIAFTKDLNGIYIINEINSNGSGSKAVLSGSYSVMQPAWSPNGTTIAAVCRLNGVDNICTVSSSEYVTILTYNSGTSNIRPTWSPDGTKIAFTSNRNGREQILVMDAQNGTNPVPLTDTLSSNSEASWEGLAPWLMGLAYTKEIDDNNEFCVTNADRYSRITFGGADGRDPELSPNRTQLAFSSNRSGGYEIYTMNIDGTGLTCLTNNSFQDYEPKWSPDGSSIVFNSWVSDNYEIFKINADGAGLLQLTLDTALDYNASWSAGGDRIYFASNRSGYMEIYWMNLSGGNVTQVTSQNKVFQAPVGWFDGKVAFSGDTTDLTKLYWEKPGIAPTQIILNGNFQYCSPLRWSPDGYKLLFNSNLGTYIVNIEGGRGDQVRFYLP